MLKYLILIFLFLGANAEFRLAVAEQINTKNRMPCGGGIVKYKCELWVWDARSVSRAFTMGGGTILRERVVVSKPPPKRVSVPAERAATVTAWDNDRTRELPKLTPLQM